MSDSDSDTVVGDKSSSCISSETGNSSCGSRFEYSGEEKPTCKYLAERYKCRVEGDLTLLACSDLTQRTQV